MSLFMVPESARVKTARGFAPSCIHSSVCKKLHNTTFQRQLMTLFLMHVTSPFLHPR